MNSPRCRRLALAALICSALSNAHAASFVYEGRLDDLGQPAHGRYDLKLSAYGHAAQGTTLAAPITFEGVEVKQGRFRLDVALPLVQADQVWLEVAVRGSGEPAFSAIPGRAKAIAASLAGTCWDTTGNVVAGGEFLGSTNNVPMTLRANNAQVMSMTGGLVNNTVNIIAGSVVNLVANENRGQTLAGGGSSETVCGSASNAVCRNLVQGNFATVSGGRGNTAFGLSATVTGGDQNTASGAFSTISGGANISAPGTGSTVSGGQNNRASGETSIVTGGTLNTASGLTSTVNGGDRNTAAGGGSIVSGGTLNCAGGDNSWTGGVLAKTRSGNEASDGNCTPNSGDADGDNGTFVWADDQGTDFVSTGPRQFLLRAQGGMGINTNKLGATADFRSVELVVRNGVAGDNTDVTLISNNNRGYNLAVMPTANGSNGGSFVIGTVDARTASETYVDRLIIAPNGDFSVSANALKPGGGAWASLSDARLKQDISSLSGSLDRLLALHGVSFRYRADAPIPLGAPGLQIGFVAQQVEHVFPQWIGEKDGFKTVAISGFEALTVEALRELRGESAVIDAAQSAELAELRRKNAELEARLQALKAALQR